MYGELESSGVQAPGNAPGFSSRVVGEKTWSTDSWIDVHPGGGSCFAAAHADTAAAFCQRLSSNKRSDVRKRAMNEGIHVRTTELCAYKKPVLHLR